MKRLFFLLLISPLIFSACSGSTGQKGSNSNINVPVFIQLPEPIVKGEMSLEEALLHRRSVREYSDAPLSLENVSQLLWAAQGVTNNTGGRTAPSAGGLYPLEVYLVAERVEGLNQGIYRYIPDTHRLETVKGGKFNEELCKRSLNQSWVKDGAINIVISGVYERTTKKYGERGVRYVHLEAGHAAQNICLQATALHLGAVTVGAFDDEGVRDLLEMGKGETPLYVIPIGRR